MRELKKSEIEHVTGGVINPATWPLGTNHILSVDANTMNNSFGDDGMSSLGSAPVVTNVFQLNNGGVTSVTGEDSNRDGVVDGYEELANSQDDIFESGSPLDNLSDWMVGDGPYSPPDE